MARDKASATDPMLAMVVAVARNGAIGRDGVLPWRLSSDLKLFRRLTMGKPLIMGRRTFESLPGALDGRDNLVVSRRPGFYADGVRVFPTVDTALQTAGVLARRRGVDEMMLIGGAALYTSMMPTVQRVYWTAVDAEPEADTFLEPLHPEQWVCVHSEPLEKGPRDDHDSILHVYERNPSVG